MKQKKLEITDETVIQTILTQARIGRLGTNGADGFPYIVPVNYVYWHESIYFHCALKGEKLDNIQKDPKVCFEVDIPLAYLDTGFKKEMPACEVTQYYQCVIIRGTAEIIANIDEKIGALNALMAGHENRKTFNEITPQTKAVKLCSVVAIRIESLSAKANIGQKKSANEREEICKYLSDRNQPGDMVAATILRG